MELLRPVLIQVMTWPGHYLDDAGLLSTSFSEICIGILSFSLKKMHLKM